MLRTSPPFFRELVALTDKELGRFDIAAVNLACAVGLPDADRIDVESCLGKLDEWSECVRSYTARALSQFDRMPHEYENSEAYFRTLAMITVLQRDKGVRYNPAKIPDDAPFDTADAFIHGITHGAGGTCATMPVVYAAVGRRLGYPIKLVAARGKASSHLFARWDDTSGERFNIEATNLGLTTPTDDYFRTGRYELTPEAERDGCYLQSQTPRMELAGFLGNRAWQAEDAGDWWKCVDSWALASSSVVENQDVRNALKRGLYQWDREQERRKPAGFPKVLIRSRGRQYPDSLPVEFEKQICGMTAVHHMLTDPRLEVKYWGPMRRGNFSQIPVAAIADFAEDSSCRINLQFN